MADLVLLLQQTDILTNAQVDPHLNAIVASKLQSTWFSTAGLETVVEQLKGSRPGNVLADLLFHISMTDLLRAIRQQCHTEGIVSTVPYNGGSKWIASDHTTAADVDPIAWFDDVAFMLMAPSDQIHTVAVRYIEIVIRQVQARGYAINFSKGKTEWMFSIHGQGAKDLEQILYISRTNAS